MPKFDLRCVQKDALIIPFRITVAAGVPTLVEGNQYLTLVDGGVGDYELTFGGQYGAPSARIPIVVAQAMSAAGAENIANVVEATLLTTGFTIEVNDDAGTAIDVSVMGFVIWFGTEAQQ